MNRSHQARQSVGALSLLAAAVPVAAQEPVAPRSAPISNIRYEVTFDRAAAAARRLRVVTTFDVDGAGPVLLSLPAWTPGAYEISNFARWVTGFAAQSSAGAALDWDQTDYDTWRIDTRGSRSVTVRFEYIADSLDNAMSWTRPDFAMFNGTNLFMYPEGRGLDFGAQVIIRTEPAWLVATGMPRGAPGAARGTYAASNFHDLVDMPFFVGRFDVDSAQIAGRWTRLATYPAGSVAGSYRGTVWDQLRKMIPPQVAVFGGDVPWDTYTILQIADTTYRGASGLEHQNSHVDVLTPLALGSDFLPSLYAHEIFHAWNVKRLRPQELWPYVYDRPQPTTLLWVSEGITDYYADLSLVRGGVIDVAGFYTTTAGKINEVNDVPAVALEDASLSTWTHPVNGTGYIYYPKGSLAGFMLDIMIRDASDNRRSLDDVLRELYQTEYKRGTGFTNAEWWAAVSRAAGGRSFQAFYERYIDGREPFPWDSILPVAGLRAVRDPQPRLGIFTAPDSGGVRITQLEPGGAAAEAGVREGDYLLAIGDVLVTDPEFGARFRERFAAASEGSPITLRVRRVAQTLNLGARLRFGPGAYRIVPDNNASAKARRIRDGILQGRTTP
ncbi:MAG: PDZ domain-containing protein [Gemmatimonadota bacterium]|nr:PDZ domain-containing protein [Gemmatimonadota bacterium]